jgi:hypothetical protein
MIISFSWLGVVTAETPDVVAAVAAVAATPATPANTIPFIHVLRKINPSIYTFLIR